MSEKLIPVPLISKSPTPANEAAKNLNFEREQLGLSLVDQGLISETFYTSGALDEFTHDETTGDDALSHLLVGDEYGGGHHLPTIMTLDVKGRTIASKIVDGHKRLGELRKSQKVKENGVFKVLGVEIEDPNGAILEKDGGSTMFPNEWSTQKVLEAILAVKQNPGERIETGVDIHSGEVEGVKIKVITDTNSGKILSAFPR